MKRILLNVFITIISLSVAHAQKPNSPSSNDIYEAIQKLNFLGSVLYVAAHPDDENTRLISYMSNHEKARTGYLALTRGDGGQNLIGPELRELLGVIRTQELLAARRIDGGEQLFTRANDFGYSKNPEETLNIWDKDAVLSDVVLAIRQFKPDIIINRFDHRTPGSTHGHHTSSAMLSMEAFDLANKESAYPSQLNQTSIWQPKRLFFNTGWWFFGSRENFEKADKSNLISFDIGVYYPTKGLSNNELASLASSQHLCQGFGRLAQRGSQKEYIEFLKGAPLISNTDVFAGINTTWNRVNNGERIGNILNRVETNFNFINPSVHIPELLKAYKLIQDIEDNHWRELKTKEIKNIITMCAGLYLEASANSPWATPGEAVRVSIEVLNRSAQNIVLDSYNFSNTDTAETKNQVLENNIKYTFDSTLNVNVDQKLTSPYWLKETGTLGMYNVADKSLIGLPETPRAYSLNFHLIINNVPITITRDVVYRFAKPDKGELYRPFEIIPEASATLSENVIIFDSDKQQEVSVIVKAGRDNLEGFVDIKYPEGWQISPEKQRVSIKKKGENQTLIFTIMPPKLEDEGSIVPVIHVGDRSYSKALVEINYDHIPFQTVLLPSETKVVRLNIKKRGQNIAYIQGAGDEVPESLEQIGYNVRVLKPDEITEETLSLFDAVVVGIRAYNTVENLNFKQQQLFNFVAKGGNMIVQYNNSYRLKVDQLAPYDIQLSRDRVTDENSKVTFLDPTSPVLNFPNKITASDFEGWTQERGLYFPNKWDDAFTPVLSMNDQGETPKKGSLLVAKHGEGYFVYTGLSFFREFPAGVSGAYRLFANMLSLGKEDLKQESQLKQ